MGEEPRFELCQQPLKTMHAGQSNIPLPLSIRKRRSHFNYFLEIIFRARPKRYFGRLAPEQTTLCSQMQEGRPGPCGHPPTCPCRLAVCQPNSLPVAVRRNPGYWLLAIARQSNSLPVGARRNWTGAIMMRSLKSNSLPVGARRNRAAESAPASKNSAVSLHCLHWPCWGHWEFLALLERPPARFSKAAGLMHSVFLSMNRQVVGQASRLPVGQASGLPPGPLARESPGSWSLSAVQRPAKLPKRRAMAHWRRKQPRVLMDLRAARRRFMSLVRSRPPRRAGSFGPPGWPQWRTSTGPREKTWARRNKRRS